MGFNEDIYLILNLKGLLILFVIFILLMKRQFDFIEL